MMKPTNNKKDGGVAVGLGGDVRRGGGMTGGEGPTASTEPHLTPVVQTGQGDTVTEQVCNTFRFINGSKTSVGDAGAGIYKKEAIIIDKNKILFENVSTENDVVAAGKANDSNDDYENSFNDVFDISTLDLTNRDDSHVNFADITLVQMNISLDNESFDKVNECVNDNDIIKDTTGMEVDEKDEGQASAGDRVKVKGKRSFPQSTNDRRFRKNQRKVEKEKYKIPDDPFLAQVDKEYMKRKSYADCVKDKDNIILEIRNEDLNISLESKDFKVINSHLLFKYLECKQQNLAELEESDCDDEESDDEADDKKFFYGVIGGISNGAVWLACDNSTTADFVKYQVPLITTNDCKYQVFTSEARPFRYMKAKIPVEFWADRKTVQGAFIASNRCLNRRVKNAAGKREAPHFKICFGCESFEDDLDEADKNFYWVQFSVDERLMTKLAELKGRLRLGATAIQLLGGGMVTKAKEVIADKLKGAIDNVEDASG